MITTVDAAPGARAQAPGDAGAAAGAGAGAELERLRIDGDRLWRSLMDLAQIGATEKGGVRRLALTDLDRLGRDRVATWMRDAGLEVTVDAIGNLFGRRPGVDPQRQPVAAGSHIDTQPSGGKFDGNFGVLAALEVVRTLDAHRIATLAPIEVAVWTNEEGTRFTPVMMGSGVFAGVLGIEHCLAQADLDGHRVGDELARIGYAGDARPGHPLEAYFEAHIEQGPVLEDAGDTIGVVGGALGQRWFDVDVTGMDAHAGPTPMRLRKDAMLATAELVLEVNRIALAHAPDARGTVGFVQVWPNSRNVVPGAVRFSVDFRAATDAVLWALAAALREAAARVCAARGVEVRIAEVAYFPPCAFAPECIDAVRRAAAALGLSHREIVSGAGHDAIYLARVAPTAMIFVPCRGGISHNELEDAKPEHLEAGANVLLQAMLSRAGALQC